MISSSIFRALPRRAEEDLNESARVRGRVYECIVDKDTCQYLGDARNAKVHVASHHIHPTSAPFACLVCGISCGTEYLLNEHLSKPGHVQKEDRARVNPELYSNYKNGNEVTRRVGWAPGIPTPPAASGASSC